MRSCILCVLAVFTLGSCSSFAIESWTMRQDGHIRASQRGEDFTLQEFIEKIKKEEGKDFALVITPKGEAEVSAQIRTLKARITELERSCHGN